MTGGEQEGGREEKQEERAIPPARPPIRPPPSACRAERERGLEVEEVFTAGGPRRSAGKHSES